MTASPGRTATHRPTRLSGLSAVVAVLVAAWLVLPGAVTPVLVGVAGAATCFLAGDALRSRDAPLGGGVAFVVGGGVALVVVGYATVLVSRPEDVARTIVAASGVLCVAMGVVPLRGRGSRGLVRLGTALVFLAVLAAGVFQTVQLFSLLTGTVLLVVTYDLGEHAIGLGEQLGRGADTFTGEATHGVSSVGIGVVAAAAGTVAPSLGTGGLSLSGLLFLLVAVAGLSLALHG
jgi:hypothetical protein